MLPVSLLLALLPGVFSKPIQFTARQMPGVIPPSNDTIKSCAVVVPANDFETCDSLAQLWGLSAKQFLTYNPSVGADCSHFVIAQQYCIQVTSEPTTYLTPKIPKGKPAPGPTAGVISSCDSYYKVYPDDTCDNLAQFYRMPKEALLSMNPGLGADCSKLKVNNYICVRVPRPASQGGWGA